MILTTVKTFVKTNTSGSLELVRLIRSIQRRSQGAPHAVMPPLIVLCRTLIQQVYIGCYDCSHKNVLLAHPQNCLATPLLVLPECKINTIEGFMDIIFNR